MLFIKYIKHFLNNVQFYIGGPFCSLELCYNVVYFTTYSSIFFNPMILTFMSQ